MIPALATIVAAYCIARLMLVAAGSTIHPVVRVAIAALAVFAIMWNLADIYEAGDALAGL